MNTKERPQGQAAPPLLAVKDLKVHFARGGSGLSRKPAEVVRAVDGVSFEVARGRTLAVVGESGSGKTTSALAVMRLAPITAGTVHLGGTDLGALEGEELRLARRRLQIVFQDPFSSLNPRQRAGDAVRAPLELMHVGSKAEREDRVAELFTQVGLRPEQQRLFPHQFSGGQRQRIGIARALAVKPRVMVCDEPVAALDVSIQAQVINLFLELRERHRLTYLFVSHNLGLVRFLCDRVAIMYLGRIVETGPVAEIFASPAHPYTQALLEAIPRLHRRKRAFEPVQGELPSPLAPPPGCPFHPRCPSAVARCHESRPDLRSISPGRVAACHLLEKG